MNRSWVSAETWLDVIPPLTTTYVETRTKRPAVLTAVMPPTRHYSLCSARRRI